MNEREFELINIVGADLGSNQRDLSRHMNLSLGMINILIRRLIAKGYIRIEQLNKRKVQYILTPKGFSEKMRKSIKYTMKTISSIGLIKSRIKEVLLGYYEQGERVFHYYGNHDICTLVEMVYGESFAGSCALHILREIPQEAIDGVILVCKEGFNEESLRSHKWVDLIAELAKENQYPISSGESVPVEN